MLSTAPALTLLGGASDDVALVSGDRQVTYGELADEIAERRLQLGEPRRLVLLAASNTLDSVITYLAALEGGHPVLLTAPGDDEASVLHRSTLIERFDPDVLALPGGRTGREDQPLVERREGSIHSFAPDLALLTSTSGSTGSPKLVRLSRENLESNARAIAEYLRLSPADRAATTLPMHYCYGLSVLNSHLIAGASLVLTDRSVTDAEFWREAEARRITSFAGVPYTFELLEAGGFAERLPASIRCLTQAGGRLPPESVRRFARLGRRQGFDFVVMYGQTEATARMAYVPPELAEQAAGAIGQPIPGGRLRVDAAPGEEVGELVYEGPNVMLGYAQSPADFALGRTVHELRTGDLARRREDGLFEVVGRLNRFVKVYGLRVDLDAVQRLLAAEGIEARTAAADERLLLFVLSERQTGAARARAAALVGLPPHAIRAYSVAEFPRTSTGKPDHSALVRYAAQLDAHAADGGRGGPDVREDDGTLGAETVRDLFAELLGRPDATADDSFAGLGGDSLSYVEVSLRLEELLGRLPRDWPSLSAWALSAGARRTLSPATATDEPQATGSEGVPAAAGPPVATSRDSSGSRPQAAGHSSTSGAARRRRGLLRVDTPAALRALAIVLIVGTHADLLSLQGGAHLLLAVAGYNLARFQLANVPGSTRVRRLLTSAAQVAVPAALWIGAVAVLSGKYAPTTALLINNLVADGGRWTEQWQFWFLEAMVWAMLALALLFSAGPVDRIERRHPWAFALALLGSTLLLRYAITGVGAGPLERYSAPVLIWLLLLGWTVARADTLLRRVIVSGVAAGATVGFFGDPLREAVIVIGVLALVWAPTLALPRPIVPAVRMLAAASLFIYLTHWVVYPAWEQSAPVVGTLLSLAVGVGTWAAYRRAGARLTLVGRRLLVGVRGRDQPEAATERGSVRVSG